jgi:hypothetical protein
VKGIAGETRENTINQRMGKLLFIGGLKNIEKLIVFYNYE